MPAIRNVSLFSLVIAVVAVACSSPPSQISDEDGADTAGAGTVGCAGCIVLTGGKVFDGKQTRLATIVIDDDHIAEVRFDRPKVSKGDVVDLDGATVLPGLIDMHVHGPSADHFRALLRSGVTTALDTGAPQKLVFAQRADLAAGKLPGPRLLATGAIITHSRGHACLSDKPNVAFGDELHPLPPFLGNFCEFVDFPEQASAAVAAIVADDPDLVKIVIESGSPGGVLPSIEAESVAAAVDAIKKAGKTPIAHVGSAADMAMALDVGVRLFAHLPFEDKISDELAARLAKTKSVVVPTLVLTDAWARLRNGTFTELDDPTLPEDVLQTAIDELESEAFLARLGSPGWPLELAGDDTAGNAMANFEACRKAGVKVAAGTDSGNQGVFHGRALRRELELYVLGGMSPAEAINAATRTAADVLGHPELGRIEPGAAADLLVIDGDPLEDIRDLSRIDSVYQAGKKIDRAKLALTNP